MFYKNSDESMFHARDMELWYPDEEDEEEQTCEYCGEQLDNGYYKIDKAKLCKECARLEFKEYFEEFEDLEELKQTYEYESEEDLIDFVIDEDLYKFWIKF